MQIAAVPNAEYILEKPLMNEIINHIMQLKQRHHITKIYVDGANPEVIRELKAKIGEYHDYYDRLAEEPVWSLRSSNSWQIIPVNFQKRQRDVAVDVYVTVNEVHQDTPITAGTYYGEFWRLRMLLINTI